MRDCDDCRDEGDRGGRFGRRALVLTLAFHALGLAAATWPAALELPSRMPLHEDSLGSLWLLRWYKGCLLEGRSHWYCTEVMHPAGVPMGSFTPMYLQAVLYTAISSVTSDDAVCWNVLVLVGVLGTGLGSTLLAWRFVADRACAAFAGLLAMLCTSLLITMNCQVELTYVGTVPLFLLAWMRFVDRPGLKGMLLASLAYFLIAASCGYYMVFAVFPAVLYLVWGAFAGGWRTAAGWARRRALWLGGMGALTFAGLLLIYSGQVWMLLNHYQTARPRSQFDTHGAPLWTYFVPTPWQRLGVASPWRPYESLGVRAPVLTQYLGVVSIGLLAFVAIRRVRFRQASYVWSAFALTVVLSMGSTLNLWGLEVSLPAGWLWVLFPPIRMTRVICRIGLLAAVFAGVLAAAGLKSALAQLSGPKVRAFVFAGLSAIAVLDLSLAHLPTVRRNLPEAPGCYAFLRRHAPGGAILEIPDGHHGHLRNAYYTYWQAGHRLATSSGITGVPNRANDDRAYFNSPFHPDLTRKPNYLVSPGTFTSLTGGPDEFLDYLWIYKVVNRFDYLVVHRDTFTGPRHSPASSMKRVEELLAAEKLFDDGRGAVYDLSRLRPPKAPVSINLGPWSPVGPTFDLLASWTSRLVVYNPAEAGAARVSLVASAGGRPLGARLRPASPPGAGDLANWTLAGGGAVQHLVSPPLPLGPGLHELTLEVVRGKRGPSRSSARADHSYRLVRLRASKTEGVEPEVSRLSDRVTEGKGGRTNKVARHAP